MSELTDFRLDKDEFLSIIRKARSRLSNSRFLQVWNISLRMMPCGLK